MPWKECSVMDERLRFVVKLLDGEAMTDVCREFGISRKTGYKIFARYKEHGGEALSDRSRRWSNQRVLTYPPIVRNWLAPLTWIWREGGIHNAGRR